MQVSKKFITAIFCALFLPLIAIAQVKTTNNKGERIILYPDGSWEYDKSAQVETTNTPETAPTTNNDDQEAKQRAINARREEAEAIKVEKMAETKLQQYENSLKAQMGVPLSKEEKQEQKTRLAELKDDFKFASSIRKSASKKARMYEKMVAMPPEQRAKALAKLHVSEQKKLDRIVAKERKNDKSTPPIKPQEVKNEVVTTTKPEESSVDTPPPTTTPEPSETPTVETPTSENTTEPIAETATTQPKKITLPLVQELDLAEKRSKDMKKYKNTFSISQETKDCYFEVDEVDEFTGKRRKSLPARVFFTHTDENIRPYMNGQEFIVCKGSISEIAEGNFVLALSFVIQTTDAAQQFGRIDENSTLSLKLLNGENIVLRNSKMDLGLVNNHLKQTLFRAYYPIYGETAKMLMKSEVSKAKMVWGAGYDVYEIYEMDFFKEQLACFIK